MTYTRTRRQWGARGNGGSSIGRVSEVIGHTEAGADISASASVDQEERRMRAIDAFHLSLGWSGGFGYSVAVFPSGRIYEGRGYRRSGAHTQGKNRTALAFVIPGHGDRTPMTDAAIKGVRSWIGEGVKEGHISSDPDITGHRDHSSKSCPGDKIYPQLQRVRGVTGPEDADPPPDDGGDGGGGDSGGSSDTIRRGSKGSVVRRWQRQLQEWNADALPRYGADGDFGDETAEWTAKFMQESGLTSGRPSNPIVGPRTRAKMEEVLASQGSGSGFSFSHSSTVRRGSKGAAVREWQEALQRWNSGALPRFGADGDFGDETAKWTARFMQESGLTSGRPSNPIVGSRTRSKMEEVLGSGGSGGGFSFSHSDTIRRGSKGAAVREWQEALQRWNSSALPRYGADGDFGNETADWTARFMQRVGLTSGRPNNPVVGPRTRRAMERELGG